MIFTVLFLITPRKMSLNHSIRSIDGCALWAEFSDELKSIIDTQGVLLITRVWVWVEISAENFITLLTHLLTFDSLHWTPPVIFDIYSTAEQTVTDTLSNFPLQLLPESQSHEL